MSVYVSQPGGAYIVLSTTGPWRYVVIPNTPGRSWPEDGGAVATSGEHVVAVSTANRLDRAVSDEVER